MYMNLRLGNRGNHCYGNSALRGFIAAAVARGGMNTMFEGAMLGFIESLLQSTGIVFLWEQPFWAALTGEWELPSRQHDGAEFILFLLNRLPFTADHATATWQARRTEGEAYRVTDWGRSAPLLLHPPARASESDCQTWSVQELLQSWKEQDALHAFSMPPGVLIVQIGRFGRTDAHARVRKHRFELVPDFRVLVPTFTHDMHVCESQYRLCASIVHVGSSPNSGHYFTLFHNADGCVVLADDNVRARFVEHQSEQYHRDIYILFYVKEEPL